MLLPLASCDCGLRRHWRAQSRDSLWRLGIAQRNCVDHRHHHIRQSLSRSGSGREVKRRDRLLRHDRLLLHRSPAARRTSPAPTSAPAYFTSSQHPPLFLVQQPHQPAQLPHLRTIGAMHCAGLHDPLEPLWRPRARAGATVHPASAVRHSHAQTRARRRRDVIRPSHRAALPAPAAAIVRSLVTNGGAAS
jgi:hypothetical protein